ncbi:MAG TPA: NBR1-Ig-like domain-containing protein [Myxococcota bacterium]|nr:NBR1-Ig-like domain-containing protein [Myxococcota bacterium]HRY92614.1 NBR1-Ig-like domain-containing protein [Myxococcota bacterium]HSA20614.1 NBR1-Ig-like domain-containing protein [Myxococcota bacterium]
MRKAVSAGWMVLVLTGAAGALAQPVLVLDDPLRGSSQGTVQGGELSADGWRVTATSDHVYWHVPTLRAGAVEFSVRGLRPAEDRPGFEDKSELFHMYDWTYQNADTDYTGYRNNPFKHFIRKTGAADTRPGKTDALELVWVIGANYMEPDTGVLSWDPATTYRFREEWGPDGGGNCVIRTYRDGVQIMEMSEPGEWAPAGHAVRIGVARLTVDSGAPLDAVFSDLQVWSTSGDPDPGLEPADPDDPPLGPTRVVSNSLVDDNGAFLGLGATYMSALWQARNNRALLQSDLAFLAARGFNYIRVLAQVGGCEYWGGLEIVPVAQLDGCEGELAPWPDYAEQLDALLDLAFAAGLRVQITIFGSGDVVVGGAAGRLGLVDALVAHLAGREHQVILLEVANEGWQTGFPGPEGLDEMQALAQYIADRTSIPVAVTSNHGVNSADEVYAGVPADIATWHFSRDLGQDDGWGPVYDCWFLETLPGVPPGSSNEPIGPGASVASEERPIRLVMAAAYAWVAKLPMYVFHTSAGVRHQVAFEDMAGVSDFVHLRHILPGDVASWARNDGKEAAAPFTAYAGGQPDRYRPELASEDGCVQNIGARKGALFVALPMGIGPAGLTLQAREPLTFKVFHPLTGEVLGEPSLAAGEQLHLPQGPEAYILTNAETSSQPGTNDAAFVSQDVPASLAPGEARAVSVRMRNTGTSSWSAALSYRLGSQAPQDNNTFDGGRAELPAGVVVAPGEEVTITVNLTAPAAPGVYTFQRRMLRENVEWFGAFTPPVDITVSEPPDGGLDGGDDGEDGGQDAADAEDGGPDGGPDAGPDAGDGGQDDADGSPGTDGDAVEGGAGCGCGTGSAGALGLPLALGLLAWRLRRREA